MGFNLKTFAISSLVLLALAAATLSVFPLKKPTAVMVYDYKIHQDVPQTKDDLTAIYLIVIETLFIFAWIISQIGVSERSINRTARQIVNDPRSSPDLSDQDITLPCRFMAKEALGEYSIGSLMLLWIINDVGRSVFIVVLQNHNYRITETRQAFESPVISISEDPMLAMESARSRLPPRDRVSFVNQYKSVLRTLGGIDPDLREKLIEKPEAQLKEDSTESRS